VSRPGRHQSPASAWVATANFPEMAFCRENSRPVDPRRNFLGFGLTSPSWSPGVRATSPPCMACCRQIGRSASRRTGSAIPTSSGTRPSPSRRVRRSRPLPNRRRRRVLLQKTPVNSRQKMTSLAIGRLRLCWLLSRQRRHQSPRPSRHASRQLSRSAADTPRSRRHCSNTASGGGDNLP